MRILITGPGGAVGAALAQALDGAHELRGLARDPESADAAGTLEVVRGDVLTGRGLRQALDGVEVAYYLIHSMEPATGSAFARRDRGAAERFAAAAARAGVRRIVYLGGILPRGAPSSPHLASRHEVERILLDAVPDSVALRSSVVVGARSQSFRAIVRLIERLPVIPLPPWRRYRTQPIDERDVIAYLAAAAVVPAAGGRALDIAGPEVLSYGAMIKRIAASLLLARPTVALPWSFGPLDSALTARISGVPLELLGPLMQSLGSDLIADDAQARALLGVPLHDFDSALEHALREWESVEPLPRPMTVVRSSVVIAAPPEHVWKVVMDPLRLAEWVTIHRAVRHVSPGPPHEGSRMEQILHLRGADIRVRWLLVECVPPTLARWEGRGPARSHALIEYRLVAFGEGTRFDYQNEFQPPFGAVGSVASRTVMGNVPQREADRSLAALRALIEAG